MRAGVERAHGGPREWSGLSSGWDVEVGYLRSTLWEIREFGFG